MSGEYRRLPGRGRRTTGRGFLDLTMPKSSVWTGDDHLLVVDDAGYFERYRRFYFRDVQAILVRRTRGWAVGLVVFGLLSALPIAGSLVTESWASYSLGVVGALLTLVFLVHASRGPTCRVTLKTAVHVEEIAAWKRLRAARKGIALLRPHLLAAQAAAEAPPGPGTGE